MSQLLQRKRVFAFLIVILFLLISFLIPFYISRNYTGSISKTPISQPQLPDQKSVKLQGEKSNPLQIAAMRKRSYPGSEITFEQTLPDGSNFHQYLVSYKSDGLKIYALLTIPLGQRPALGWPVIVF